MARMSCLIRHASANVKALVARTHIPLISHFAFSDMIVISHMVIFELDVSQSRSRRHAVSQLAEYASLFRHTASNESDLSCQATSSVRPRGSGEPVLERSWCVALSSRSARTNDHRFGKTKPKSCEISAPGISLALKLIRELPFVPDTGHTHFHGTGFHDTGLAHRCRR
jgi:hypothetical protein